MSNVAGEDRSSFQAVAGWAGDGFGIAKASEGLSFSDPTFAGNWKNIRGEGKPRGAYHYFHPAESAAGQARYFVNSVAARGGVEPGDFFVADVEITVGLDGLEDYGTSRAAARAHQGLRAEAPHGLTAASVGPLALEFLRTVSSLVGPSHHVLLYTDLYMAQNLLGGCTAYPLFIAAYGNAAPSVFPWKSWTFWQTGALGPGRGDLDYFNGDAAALKAWMMPSPGPKPLPASWIYQEVRALTAKAGQTSVALQWESPLNLPGYEPAPAVGQYQIAITPGPKLNGPDITSYPRVVAKSVNPETWQGGSLKPKTQYTAGVRAATAQATHAGEWATVTFTTT
jgi:lysozyme